MDLIAQCLLFVYLLNVPSKIKGDLELQNGFGCCRLYNVSIGSTFNRARNCTYYYVDTVIITEPSKELFDHIADGIHSLDIIRSFVESVYLPSSLNVFRFTGTPEYATKIVIEENASYKLQEFYLLKLPQLPANVDKLQSLKSFGYSKASEGYVDFTTLTKMSQLEEISIEDIAGVTLPGSSQLPSLRILSIKNSPTTVHNETACQFPNLELLWLENDNLIVVPETFNTCANLTGVTIIKNCIHRITLNGFANLNQLVSLTLSNNQISEIATQNRAHLPSLTLLYLNSNNLTVLDVSLWSMPALKYLSLGDNKLKQVAGLLTLYTWKMQSLIMADNPLDGKWMKLTEQKIPIMHWTNGSWVAEDQKFDNKTKGVL